MNLRRIALWNQGRISMCHDNKYQCENLFGVKEVKVESNNGKYIDICRND